MSPGRHCILAASILWLGTIAAPAVAVTVTTLSSTVNPSFSAQSTTLTAEVLGSLPTGTVSFTDLATLVPGCESVPLAGTGDTRTASCVTGGLAPGDHAFTAAYSGDVYNSPSIGQLTQMSLLPTPGTGTILSNPFGNPTVTGASLQGATISGFGGNTVITLGPLPGPGTFAIDFDKLNLGPGSKITFRAGAPDQAVVVYNYDTRPSIIAGTLSGQKFAIDPPPLEIDSPSGMNVYPTGTVSNYTGLRLDLLAGSFFSGKPLVNDGVVDGGTKLEMFTSKITGGGEFRGDDLKIHTYGNANNPVHGPFFLQNGLTLKPGLNNLPQPSFYVTLNAYGTSPQVINLRMLGNVSVWMPSAFPASLGFPANSAVVPPGGSRPPGVPEPTYGGGSMILQATGALSFFDGGPAGTHDFAFPGGIAVKSDFSIDFKGVYMNQGWTTTGKAFQGLYFEAPSITDSVGSIKAYSNDLNWTNFSTFPMKPVSVSRLTMNGDGSASYAPADLIAPHLNTYSLLVDTAASGGCWTCLVNTQPVDMTGR